jgi:MraZ protein
VFRGIHTINIDDKGRMAIPSRYREKLVKEAQGQMIVTIDTEEACLLLYPLPDWEIIESKIEALPSFHTASRRIQRLLIGHATEVEMDGQGRILLPLPLREYAGLQKNITLVGQGKKFEIWEEHAWNATRKDWIEDGLLDVNTLPAELGSLSL